MDNIPVVLIFAKYAIPTVILVVIMPLIVLVVICKQVHMYSFIITFVYENAQLTIMDKHLTTLASVVLMVVKHVSSLLYMIV